MIRRAEKGALPTGDVPLNAQAIESKTLMWRVSRVVPVSLVLAFELNKYNCRLVEHNN